MRYKSHLLFGLENDPVSVSLTFLGTGFFSDKRKACRRQGETTVMKHQPDWMSEDEPSSKGTINRTDLMSVVEPNSKQTHSKHAINRTDLMSADEP